MCKKWTSLISIVVVLCLTGSVWAGLIGHWKFDDNSGTTARDSSGKNNNGRLVGGPMWVSGHLGKALDFDGVDDYVEVPHNASLIPTKGKATVCVWINAERHTGPGGSEWQGILAKGSWDPRLFNLYTHSSQSLHFSTGPGSATIGSLSTGKVPLNEWVHVAVAVDGKHIFYINGDPAGEGGQGATVPASGTAALTIGQTGESNFFLGMIDDVRLYDRALTAEQVKSLFNGAPPVFGKAENPNPANGQVGVMLSLLQWAPGESVQFQDVYVGTTPDLTIANRVATRQSAMTKMYFYPPGFTSGQTYYWRIDGTDAAGNVYTGDVWKFTMAPVKAFAPSPADGAMYVLPDVDLAWSPGITASLHEVYFGTNRDDVAAGAESTARGEQATMTFDPGPLQADTTYYWRIDEVGTTGLKETGYLWSFRTMPDIPLSDPNLVGWWKLDEIVGPVVVDWSGHGNHGTWRGAPAPVTGYDGGALKLNGTGDYVEVPHNDSLAPTGGKASVMAWINAERHTGVGGAEWQGVIGKGDPRLYNLYTHSSQSLHFSTGPSGSYTGTLSTGKVPLNEWVHVAAVVDGKHQYYINGEAAGTEGTGATVPTGSSAPFMIGQTGESNFFLGMIDDVRLYNVALTQDQVREAMRGDPRLAWDPYPVAGRIVDIRSAESLTWQAGEGADQHDVYFGTDAAALVTARTDSPEYKGRQADTSYPLGGLVEFGGGTYFWRIDEVEADATTVHQGRVWSFTVADYLIVDDFEAYTDDVGSRIFQTWIDGWGYTEPAPGNPGNGTGSTVGYTSAPFAERSVIHGGRQGMPFDYNNTIQPYYSETDRTFAAAQDLTLNGVNTLSLWFRGYPARFTENPAGVYTMSSISGDIWNAADHFRFAYKRLNGDGVIVAKVNSVTNTADWAKAGVMIRGGLDAGANFALMAITPVGRRAFQNRPIVDGVPASAHSEIGQAAAPFWVKVERKGNQFTAYYSPDGKTWTRQPDNENTGTDASPNPQTITMSAGVYIGLALAGNNTSAACIAEFSDVAITGSVTGQWQVADVGGDNPGNDPAQLYVALQDGAGKTVVVKHPDLNAVLKTDWTEWQIPLTQFTGVNTRTIRKMFVGVGDRVAPQADGTGKLFIDDIRVIKP